MFYQKLSSIYTLTDQKYLNNRNFNAYIKAYSNILTAVDATLNNIKYLSNVIN